MDVLVDLRDAEAGLYRDLPNLEQAPEGGLWNLEQTYYAAYFARAMSEYEDVATVLPADTVAAVEDALPLIRERDSVADLLMAAIILEAADSGEPGLAAEAVERTRAWFKRPVSRKDVFQARLLYDLYIELTQADDLTMHFAIFPVETDDDRAAAWTVLSLVENADNADELEAAYGSQRDAAAALIADPEGRQVKDVYLAFAVVGSGVNPDELTPAFDKWLTSLEGCPYAPHYYEAAPGTGICTLQATYQLMRLGLEDRGWA